MTDRYSDLAAEFAARPFGRHTAQLQDLLERMRSAPIPGKYFLYLLEPGRRWALARMSETEPPRLQVALDLTYESIENAERDVFRRRLAAMRGEPISDPEFGFEPATPSVMGYASRDSVRAGESLDLFVSSESERTFYAEVVRLCTPDVGPLGLPLRTERVSSAIDGDHPSVQQWIHPGSYIRFAEQISLSAAFGVSLRLCPTLLSAGRQTVIGLRNAGGAAWSLIVETDGRVGWEHRTSEGQSAIVWSATTLRERHWFHVLASADTEGNALTLGLSDLTRSAWSDTKVHWSSVEVADLPAGADWDVVIGAAPTEVYGGHAPSLLAQAECREYFNGRIEGPRLHALPINQGEAATIGPGQPISLVADWDFADGISTERVTDLVGNRHGKTINLPTRGVRSSSWSATHLDWRSAPQEYAAIHFHDDDIADAGWQPSLQLTVPDTWASGCYAVRLSAGDDEFFVPFFVRPPTQRQASVAFLVPTATYAAYANMRLRLFGQAVEVQHARLTVVDATDLLVADHPELGRSTYDTHRDGSLVCYSSLRRPVTNFRPNGRIYKFCQDLLVTSWLDHEGVDYDVVTDEDVHREGFAAIEGYATVVTSSHPEYTSRAMIAAVERYLGTGGRLVYLGGNGFYNGAEFHDTMSGTVEVRRPGMEALWPVDHTEGHFSFTGLPAGPLGKVGLRSEPLVGVAFITQGFDTSSYYRRTPESKEDRVAFIFDGIDDEVIGDFGLLQGGAAGYELDRFDLGLGSPDHAVVLARSEAHSNVYDLMMASLLDRFPKHDADAPDAVRADLVFFETNNGGAVFSVGSIAWSGSLAWNSFDNTVARVSRNVLRRFIDPTPFQRP